MARENLSFYHNSNKLTEDQLFDENGEFDVQKLWDSYPSPKYDAIYNPYYGWYVIEGKNAELQNGGETGHYYNVISTFDPSVETGYTGFAYNSNNNYGYTWQTYGQVWDAEFTDVDTTQSLTVDEYVQSFNAYYDSVKQAITDAQTELESAKKTLNDKLSNDATQDITEASNKLNQLKEELSQLEETQKAKEDKIQSYEDTISGINEEKENYNDRLSELNQEINDTKSKMSQLDTQIKNAQTQLDNANTELTDAKNEKTRLQGVADAKGKTVEEKENALQTIYNNIDKAQKQLDDSKDARDDRADELKAAQTAEDSAKTKAELAKKAFNQATKDKDNAQTELDNAGKTVNDKNRLLTAAKNAVSEMESYKISLDNAKAKVESLDEDTKDITTQIQNIKARAGELGNKIAEVSKKIELDEADVQVVKDAIANWNAIKEDITKEFGQYTDAINEVAPDIEEYKPFRLKSTELLNQLKADSDVTEDKEKTLVQAKDNLQNAENTLKDAQSDFEEYKDSLVSNEVDEGKTETDNTVVTITEDKKENKDNGKDKEIQNTNTGKATSENNAVKTGDNTDIAMYAMLGLAGVAGAVALKKKKENA